MKTLIVNCSLKTKSEALVEAVRKFSDVLLADFSLVDERHRIGSDIDAVIISGSSARIVDPYEREMFSGVADLIRTCDLPLLGICYGHQLICHTLGAQVGSLPEGIFRFQDVRLIDFDEVFSGFSKGQAIPLSESHYDHVLKKGLSEAGFVLLADSASCEVEAVKHRSKPFYGFQFHPERITVENETHPEGHKIIENFYKNVVKL